MTSSTSSGEGIRTLNATCTDRAGNTGQASYSVKVDKTAPALNPSVAPNPVFLKGSAIASPNATDNLSGVASTSCGTVSTSSVGTKSVSCSATDKAGNSATATASYKVIYNFTGFFSPVSNPPALNQVSATKVVVLTFSLAGNQGLNVLAAGFPASRPIDCNTLNPLGTYQLASTSKNGFKYNTKTSQYSYSWTPDKAWIGTCRQFDLKLNDGTEHVANFKFTK